jgi:aspartate/methionine/tyrosine aminotransferase
LARWGGHVRYDLSASESATLTLPALLAMAGPEDAERWQNLTLGYANPHGADWLRATIAARYETLAADDVVCCAGAQEGLACVFAALLNPDDHAIIVLPLYQPSEHVVTSICAATGVVLAEAEGWRLDVGRVAAAIRPETKLVFTNFPNSPTGVSIDPGMLRALVELCRRHGLWLVNDEVYRTTVSDPAGAPKPVADLYERGISVASLSKGFGLAGLRVGWVGCRDRALLARVLQAKSGLSSCLAAPNEVLAHIALQAEAAIIGRNRAIAMANRDCLDRFYAAHSDVFEAGMAHNLAFSSPRILRDDASAFTIDLVRATGVLVMPWTLWRSPLGQIPTNRLRIGLGNTHMPTALSAMEAYLRALDL